MRRHANWIAGASRPSGAGLERCVSRRAGADAGRLLGEWPRSGPEDLTGALAGLEPPGLDPRSMAELLHRALADLSTAARADGAGPLAEGLDAVEARLGLQRGALAPFQTASGLGQPDFGLGAGGPGSAAAGGAERTALLVHWTHGVRGLVASLFGELLDGRAVLLLADGDLPMAAEVLAQALLAAGLPPRSLAVAFGATPEALAVLSRDEAGLRWAGRLGSALRADLETLAGDEPGLGRVLTCLPGPTASTWGLEHRARDLGLDPEDDLERLADELFEAAFAPGRGYFGLGHGAPLLAAVPARVYAAFVAAMVERFDRHVPELDLPVVPGPGADLVDRYRARWRGLVDEGATIVAGGEALRGPGGLRLAPALLVNVDPAELRRPGPEPLAVLGLVRCPAHLAPARPPAS